MVDHRELLVIKQPACPAFALHNPYDLSHPHSRSHSHSNSHTEDHLSLILIFILNRAYITSTMPDISRNYGSSATSSSNGTSSTNASSTNNAGGSSTQTNGGGGQYPNSNDNDLSFNVHGTITNTHGVMYNLSSRNSESRRSS
jgi:hypothetical protein